MSVENVSYYEDFKEIEKKLWALLTRAVSDRNSEFRTPVFICGDKNNLDGRVVVLRKADEQNLTLQFHSDIRSTKIGTIKNNPNSSLLFYGKKEKIQLRMKINSEIHYKNEIAKESWNKTGHISRKCYLVEKGPGTLSSKPTSGLKPDLDNFEFSKEQGEEGYKNFTVIQCKIKSMEWLYLAAKGHRRARFELDNNKEYWLVP